METGSSIRNRVPHAGVAAACLLTLAFGAWSRAADTSAPETIAPGAGQTLALTLAARGVQIYECRASKNAAGYEWTFVAPDAELLDARGQVVGVHGAGPFWQAADGSRVVGTVKERADSPIPGAIPWLLLGTRSVGPAGVFSKVASIQRVNTEGGTAPRTGCSAETAGRSARIAYTADYRFFNDR